MTVQDIVTLIQSVGFPIVMCGLMAWYVKYITDKNREEMQNERESFKEDMTAITQAINNNTLVIQKLTTIMENQEKGE